MAAIMSFDPALLPATSFAPTATDSPPPRRYRAIATAALVTLAALFGTAGALADTLNIVAGNGQAGASGSTATQPIVVELRDDSGAVVAGRTINWTDQTPYTRVAAATSVTDSNGRATMGFTYLQGPASLTGATGVIRAANSANTAEYAEATASALGFNVLRMVSPLSQSGLVGSAGTPIVVRLTDWNGAPVAGATVTWFERLSSGLVSLGATSSVTDANGNTSITFQYVNPGSGDITAQYGPDAIDMHFVSVGSDHMVLITPNNTYGAPGTHSTSDIVVEERDAHNQPVAGRTIEWRVLFGDAVPDRPTSVTDANGRARMGFTHGTVLSVISAHDPLIVNPNPSEPNYAADADTYSNPTNPANQSTLRLVSGSGQTGLAGTAAAQPLVVEIRDVNGNPVVGVQVFYAVSGDVVLDPAVTLTDANGRASKSFTYGGPGQSMIQAARNFGTPSGTAAYVQFHVTATGIEQITGVSGDGQTGLVGSHSAQPLVAELRDARGQPVVGRTITWIVNGGNAVFDAPTSLTDSAGRASMSFTFGPSASINGLEARDTSTGVHVGFLATGVGANSATVVAGSGQAGEPNAASTQPIEVEFRDAMGAPVVGQAVNWAVVSGSAILGTVSPSTDSNGRASASFNFGPAGGRSVIEASLGGDVRVRVTVNTTATATVVATLPNLTPAQQATAEAIDTLCPALSSKPSLTPEESDLLARCLELESAAGSNAGAAGAALSQLVTQTEQAQTTATISAANAQLQNLNTRMQTLRTGAPVSPLGALSITGPGGTIAVTSLLSAFGANPAPGTSPGFDRWGFFVSGNIGRGENKPGHAGPAYDFDFDGLTAGVDYRQGDAWIFGGALGYTRQTTDLADNAGDLSMTGWSVSGYSSYAMRERWHLDGVLSWGRNHYDLNRRIVYQLPIAGAASINQIASGRPDGDLLSASLNFGGDFHRGALSFNPYGQVSYSRTGFDAYEESLLAGPGSGLGLAVAARTVTALTGALGTRLSYAHSVDWGVVLPTASLEWNHEFQGDPDAITARFINDPTQTPIVIRGDSMDRDYFRLGFGLTVVMSHGRSGYFRFERIVNRGGLSQESLSIGFRMEF